jgi:hypothetical protein
MMTQKMAQAMYTILTAQLRDVGAAPLPTAIMMPSMAWFIILLSAGKVRERKQVQLNN